MVLFTIIPGMRIDVHNYGMQLMDSGENGYKVELVSIRENMPSIPIRMEFRRNHQNHFHFKCFDSGIWKSFYLSGN